MSRTSFMIGKFLSVENVGAFFHSKVCAALIAMLLLLGHIFAIEFYLNILIILLVSVGLVVGESMLPFITALCGFIYQISIVHAPGVPTFSYYYFTGARLAVLILLSAVLLLSLFEFFFVKMRGMCANFGSFSLFWPLVILSAAFLLNGAFGGAWRPASFVWGTMQVLVYFLLFYAYIYGTRDVSGAQLLEYVVFMTALLSLVVSLETFYLYLTRESLFEGGEVVKEEVLYGWGIWNNAGQHLSVYIPILFLGVIKYRGWWFYLVCAVLSFVSAVMTLSRTALIFSSLAFCVGLVLCCFFGEKRRIFRIGTPILGTVAAVSVFLTRERIFTLLSDYFERGLSDNGRFELWQNGISAFLDAPIFGKGFFGLESDGFSAIDIIPMMMHNTVVELLSACGIFGFLAYVYYRYTTAKLFFERPSLEKSMIGMAILVILGGSLLENFIFYVQPMFYISLILAVACRLDSDGKGVPKRAEQ